MNTTKALVEHVLMHPERLEWTLQGFGMLRCYFDDDRIRLHVWDSNYAVPDVSAIHDHPWDFTSEIVAGQMVNRRYVEMTPPILLNYNKVTIQCGLGGCVKSPIERVNLWARTPELYSEGQFYSQKATELHVSEPSQSTVTLITRTFGPNRDLANVYWPDGPWVSAEPRPAKLSEVMKITRSALDRWF